jgi:transcriptional regulator with XRE-family HTH domain
VVAQPPDPRTQRVARLLETLVRVQGISLRHLERQLGVSMGTVRRIFNGVIALKLSHILDILEILDIPPAIFFRIAFEDTDPQISSEAQELLLQAQRITRPTTQRKIEPVPDESFLRLVEVSLQKLGVIPSTTPKRAKKKARR